MLNHALFAIKEEATYGLDAFGGSAPGADDWACVMSPSVQSRRVYIENNCVRPWHSGVPHESIGSHVELSFELPLQGKSGAAGTGPPAALLAAMKAAGNKFTISAGVSSQAAPITFHSMADAPSCSIWAAFYWSDGTVSTQLTRGVRLNMNLRATGENPVVLAFEGRGLYSEMASTTAAAPADPAVFSGNKPHFLSNGMTLLIEGESFGISSLDLGVGWSIEDDNSIVGAAAKRGFHLVRTERIAGSTEFTNHAEFKVAMDASRDDSLMTFAGSWTNGSDTVALAMEIQFLDPEMAAGAVFTFPCSFACVVLPAAPNTDYLLTWT
jgi:hypothetical protein